MKKLIVASSVRLNVGLYSISNSSLLSRDRKGVGTLGAYTVSTLEMKPGWIILLAAAGATAQESAPSGFLRGQLLSWTGTPRAGEFTFQASENHVYFCSYDEKTYFEREKRHITIAGTEKGDRLELVSDQRQGSTVCYARTVHIMDEPRIVKFPGVRPRTSPVSTPDLAATRGTLTFSGVVLKATPQTLYLRSPAGDRSAIRLRPDTRYLIEGQPVEVGTLRAHLAVFVRAGKNLDHEVEAYQVVWGEILQPEQ